MTNKTFELLKAIRDGGKYTKANRVIAPLGQAALIEVVYQRTLDGKIREDKSGIAMIDRLKLSAWGKTVLAFEERERNSS